jgi:hypothetical protein
MARHGTSPSGWRTRRHPPRWAGSAVATTRACGGNGRRSHIGLRGLRRCGVAAFAKATAGQGSVRDSRSAISNCLAGPLLLIQNSNLVEILSTIYLVTKLTGGFSAAAGRSRGGPLHDAILGSQRVSCGRRGYRLAPRALSHASLGHRPRNLIVPDSEALKARLSRPDPSQSQRPSLVAR